MKFKYVGDIPIRDIGLSLEKHSGADVTGLSDDYVIKTGDIITTTDEKCIKIMKGNPNYEIIIEEKKKTKKDFKNKK